MIFGGLGGKGEGEGENEKERFLSRLFYDVMSSSKVLYTRSTLSHLIEAPALLSIFME